MDRKPTALLDRELDRLYVDHVAELEGRYARVIGEASWDAVVIHSGLLAKRSAFDDQYWPLRPVPHWQHWLPLAEPDCALVVRPRPTRYGRRARRSTSRPCATTCG